MNNFNIYKQLVNNSINTKWNLEYKVGDIWTDSNGKRWRKIGNNTRIEISPRKIESIVPTFCPQCKKNVSIGNEYYLLNFGYCVDCFAEEEHKKLIAKNNETTNKSD